MVTSSAASAANVDGSDGGVLGDRAVRVCDLARSMSIREFKQALLDEYNRALMLEEYDESDEEDEEESENEGDGAAEMLRQFAFRGTVPGNVPV